MIDNYVAFRSMLFGWCLEISCWSLWLAYASCMNISSSASFADWRMADVRLLLLVVMLPQQQQQHNNNNSNNNNLCSWLALLLLLLLLLLIKASSEGSKGGFLDTAMFCCSG